MVDFLFRASAAMPHDAFTRTATNHPGYRRGFSNLMVTQFQGGFSDNMLKWVVSFLVLGLAVPQEERDRLFVLIVPLLFSVPFLLFSMAGGYLADRYSKRTVVIGTKCLEVGVALIALAGLALHNLSILCAAGFLISTQAALFGPSKYGLLPELLPERRLSWGNGILELGTFMAIISGTIAAGEFSVIFAGREYWSGVILVGLAAVGLAASFGISPVPAAKPSAEFRPNPLGDLFSQIREIRKDDLLSLAVAGNMYFWFLGALLLINVVLYANDILHVTESDASRLLAASSLGIGLGSFLAGYLSGGKIEYGLIPLGAVGITATAALLARPGLTFVSVAVHLAVLGFFAGFFAVPINALIQHRPPPDRKGSVIAAANLLSFVGVALQPIAQYAMIYLGHPNPARVFLITALLTLAATIYAVTLRPDSLLRLALWILTHSVYQIRIEGRENIPETGGALFIANRMSLVDALLLIASTDRSIRFLIPEDIYHELSIKPFAKAIRAIPISSEPRPPDGLDSLCQAREAIGSGEAVCMLAEGQTTRMGQLASSGRAIRRLTEGVNVPIVPVNLQGAAGGLFGFERGRFLWRVPPSVPSTVTVTFGSALPTKASPSRVRAAVKELESDAWRHHRNHMHTLDRAMIRTAHRHPFRFAMGDKRRPRMKWGNALLSSIFLARRLRRAWEGQEMVGILLPPSVPGALVNYAAMLAGKIPVNLNYTSPEETLASCAAQCKIETVVSTKLLLDQIPLKVPGKTILLEESASGSRLGERVAALLMWFLPSRWLERALTGGCRKTIDDLATVIFSSGSTGEPKGVMLTHYNIASNLEQVGERFMLSRRDCMLGVLPFSDSFGSTITLWLPALLGIGVAYHPSPFDLGAVSKMVRDYGVTFLPATPQILEGYTRGCLPEDFGSIEFVAAGIERLPKQLALAFEDRFGIRPLEGYGAAECSALVAVNTRDFRPPRFPEAAKRGPIGSPLPAVSIRIVDPETRQPLPVGTRGLLLVRGPTVMKGYLGKTQRTADVLEDGWYATGDIAAEDEDGLLTITDRLSRFSRIGGEMVPHGEIEESLYELAQAAEAQVVVTGVPDGRGERLAVLHTLSKKQVEATIERLAQAGLPSSWTPRADQFFYVAELPYLASGKPDLRRIRDLAIQLSGARPGQE